MKYLLLTFDLEEFVVPKEKNMQWKEEELFRISLKGLKEIIELLGEKKVKATFFTTSEFAEFAEKEIKKLKTKGNEIAVHGLKHSDNYKAMAEEKALEKIEKAKKNIEEKFGMVFGFRAPNMQPPAMSVLKKAGFAYDSSLHPTIVPGYYNNFFGKRIVFEEEGILRVPASVTPVLRIPFSWFWFRNFGLNYAKLCSELCLLNVDFVNIYFHPWEFFELEKFNEIPTVFKRNTGKKMKENLGNYISWAARKNIQTSAITEYLKKLGLF